MRKQILFSLVMVLIVIVLVTGFYLYANKAICGNGICESNENSENCPVDCSSYVLHEWGVLLKDSIRTTPLIFSGARTLKPVIYIYSNDDFDLSLSIDFENGEAEEVWPYIPTGKKITWEDLKISSDCETTPFPEQQWDMKEIYELGDYVVDIANCITYENTTSKILFYNGKIDFGNIITGYYVDLEDKKQITLTNNLDEDISNIYINYKEPLIIEEIVLGVLKIDKLKAGETKTFDINVNGYNILPIAWQNQGKEFKQKLINQGLYTDEANKFMVAWEDTFFGIHYGYDSNIDYRDGMNIIFILPEEKYNELFKLETSIEPKEVKRVSVVYSSIEESVPIGTTAGATGVSAETGEECESYTNQIKIYCNPFLSTYDEELCGIAENNYEDNDCCYSES